MAGVLNSRRFFTLWVGLGVPPFFFGAAWLGFRGGVPFGLVNLLIMTAWAVTTARTTCRRCSFYGTAKCGLPGLVVPLFLSRLPAASMPLARLRSHYLVDLAMVLYINLVYLAFCPPLLVAVAVGSLVTWWTVFRPKRFHGLLPRLARPRVGPRDGRVSLPVISTGIAA